MSKELSYRISDQARGKLETYVLDLKQNPRGKLIGATDFSLHSQPIKRRDIVNVLPPGLSEADFAGILMLSLLTEAPTDSYTPMFVESGKRYDADWMSRFTTEVWAPDEYEHADPFKAALLDFGYDEEELDRRVRVAKEIVYEHSSGKTPVELTTFGEIQEDLTEGWYKLIYPILRPVAPLAAERIRQVTKRESLHKAWYRDLTWIQVEDDPDLVHQVADCIATLKLPGNSIVPDLEVNVRRWMLGMGADLRDVEERIVRLVSASIGYQPGNIGGVAVDLAAAKVTGPWSIAAKALERTSRLPIIGKPTRYLVGQAVQEREGMKPRSEGERIHWDKTQTIRGLVVRQMERVMGPLFHQDEVKAA